MAIAPEATKVVEKLAAATTDAVTDATTAMPQAAAAIAVPVKARRRAKLSPKPAAKRTTRVISNAKPVKAKRPTNVVAAEAASKAKEKTMTDTVKTMTAQGEKIVAELKTRTEDTVAKGKQLFTEWNDFGKGNVEAIVESGKIAAKGFEKLGQDQAEFARKSFEQTTAAFKGMAAIKSPTELAKLHSDYVRSSFDALVAQTSHSTEAMLKLVGEIAQPLSNRFAVAAAKVKLAA